MVSTGAHARDAACKAGNKAPFLQGRYLVFRGPAVKRDAVDLAGVVHRDDVAQLSGALDRDQRRAFLGERLEAAVDVAIVDDDGRAVDFEAGVLAELDVGTDLDGGLQAHRAAVLGFLDHFHLGALDRLELVLTDRLGIDLGHDLVDRLAA